MDSGFEALPPRDTGRGAKRRRAAAGAAAPSVVALAAPAGTADSGAQDEREVYSPSLVAAQYEFLDHTADVQIHSWANTLGDAFAYAALAMFAYKTDADGVDIDPACTRRITAAGHDLVSLLYNFMDACLFEFATDDFVARDMRVAEAALVAPGDAKAAVDKGAAVYSITVVAFGERFSLTKHAQGTEIKAITYSNLQIFDNGALYTAGDEVQGAHVPPADSAGVESLAAATAVDGAAAVPGTDPHGEHAPQPGAQAPGTGRRRAACDVYIIVDI